MSVRVIAILHPFKTERIEKTVEATSLEEIYKNFSPLLSIDHAFFQINDEPVKDISRIPQDGDAVIIRVLPSGNATNATPGNKTGAWVGGILLALGVIMMFNPISLIPGLIFAGFGAVIGGLSVGDMYKSPQGEIEEQPKADPQIRGSKNSAKPWGAIPIILGKHLITPPFAAKPFTEIAKNTQYLHQLFAVGFNQLNITNMKIGDTLVSHYKGVQTEIIADGELSSFVPNPVCETSINQQLKYNEPVIKTTPSETDQICVDIVLPNGLVEFNNKGEAGSYSIVVEAYFKPTGAPDDQYQTLGFFGDNSSTIIGNDITTIRRVITRAILPGESGYAPGKQYDVKIVLLTVDDSSSKIVDQVYYGSLRSVKFIDSISQAARHKVCAIGIRIKATDQLNDVIDQFNCVAESVVPDYQGFGTGKGAWIKGITSNPASLFLWILQGPVNPRPVPDSQIDWPALEKWHVWCNATNHTCNAVIDNQIVVKEILSQICSTGRASLTMQDGKYSVILDVEKTIPIQLFTPRNSWGFAGAKVFADRPHALQITFIDAERGWQQNERIVYDDGYNADGTDDKLKATKFLKLTFWGVTNADQIWMDGRYQIAVCRLRPETFVLNCDIENLVCTRGDLVRVAHDVPLLGLYAGRIKQLVIDNGSVTGIVSDELIRMVEGKEYGIRIRKSDGTIIIKSAITLHGETNIISFETPPALSENIQPGDLFSFGYNNIETMEMIITGIEARKDLTATMYLIPASPGIHLADQGVIPEYNSAVSMPGDFSSQLQITSPASTAQPTVITAAQQAAQIGDIINQLQSIPTANELLYGTVKGDWTETPEKPSFKCTPLGSSVMIEIVKQYNLSNFLHYAIRISKDQLNWYSLDRTGTGANWKDKPGEYTPWEVELFVHSKLPLAGTSEDPQPETYYYQVAIVTQKMVMSPWSDTAGVTVSPIQNGDIAANFLAANMALIGNLTALFFQTAYAVIGYRGTGTNDSPHEADTRTFLGGDEIKVGEELTGGLWNIIKGIIIGGRIDGLFSGMIGCKGLYHPESPPQNIEYFPTNDYLIYKFDGNYNNHYGIDDWSLKINQAIDTDCKFGSGSFFATAGNASYLRRSTQCKVGFSQTVACWIKCTEFDSGNATLFYFYYASNYFAVYLYNFMVVVEIMKGGVQRTLSSSVYLCDSLWHYIVFLYNTANQTVYLLIDNSCYSLPTTGEWSTSNFFTMSVYAYNHFAYSPNNFITYKIDELCIGYNTFIPPAIFIQHFNHNHPDPNHPWNTKYSAADVIYRCNKGGRHRFDTQQPFEAAGLPHFTGLTAINFENQLVTTTEIIVDLASYLLPGTTSVGLNVSFWRQSGEFKGAVAAADKSTADDYFISHNDLGWIDKYIETRLSPNLKFKIWAVQGTAQVTLKLKKAYA